MSLIERIILKHRPFSFDHFLLAHRINSLKTTSIYLINLHRQHLDTIESPSQMATQTYLSQPKQPYNLPSLRSFFWEGNLSLFS
jgi:hypothetical protein